MKMNGFAEVSTVELEGISGGDLVTGVAMIAGGLGVQAGALATALAVTGPIGWALGAALVVVSVSGGVTAICGVLETKKSN